MNFLDSLFSVIEKSIQEETEQKKKELNLSEKIDKLKEIKKDCENRKFYIDKHSNPRNTKWASIINTAYEIQQDRIKENPEEEEKFKENMIKAYELTTSILSDLGIINSVRTVVTSISKEENGEYSYFRFPNFELKAEYTYLSHSSKEKGYTLGLKLKQTEIKRLKDLAKIKDAEKAFQKHFNAFISPFVEYEKKAVNTTHWKINLGVLGETFENHLEQVSHNSIDDLKKNNARHFGSIGKRWILYRKSAGSDPFFTGPDTKLSQVKNANASILSNLLTLIETMEGILKIVDNQNELNRPKKDLQKIFKQADFKYTIKESVFRDLQNQSPKVVASILRELLKENIKIVTLTSYGGKENHQKSFKINTETATLEGFI